MLVITYNLKWEITGVRRWTLSFWTNHLSVEGDRDRVPNGVRYWWASTSAWAGSPLFNAFHADLRRLIRVNNLNWNAVQSLVILVDAVPNFSFTDKRNRDNPHGLCCLTHWTFEYELQSNWLIGTSVRMGDPYFGPSGLSGHRSICVIGTSIHLGDRNTSSCGYCGLRSFYWFATCSGHFPWDGQVRTTDIDYLGRRFLSPWNLTNFCSGTKLRYQKIIFFIHGSCYVLRSVC